MSYIELIVVALMILVNGMFASYEIALASVSMSRLQLLSNQGKRGANAAIRMKDGIEKSLAVVQLGITIVGLTAGATGGASASEDIAPVLREMGFRSWTADILAISLWVLPLTILTIVIGELVPKLFALRNKEWVCLKLSPWMWWFAIGTWPVIWVLEWFATKIMDSIEKLWIPKSHIENRNEAIELQELRAIASLARASRLIGSREENIILGAARLASRQLQEILLPANQIHMLFLEDSLADSLIAAHMDMHTRFPVTSIKGDPQQIVGYVTFKDIVTVMRFNPQQPSLKGILREILKLEEKLVISAALERLLRERTHIALVVDANGAITGMITLEDIMEELLGDIQDEYDLLPLHVVKSGDGWLSGGGASIQRLRSVTGLDFPADDASQNLHHWTEVFLGHAPVGGDVVNAGNVKVVVRKVRRQRVLEAFISRVR